MWTPKMRIKWSSLLLQTFFLHFFLASLMELYSLRYGSKDMLSLHNFSVIRSNRCCCISLVVHSVVVIKMLSVLNKLQRLCRNISFSLKKTSTILRILIFVFFIYALLTVTGYQGELSITFLA